MMAAFGEDGGSGDFFAPKDQNQGITMGMCVAAAG